MVATGKYRQFRRRVILVKPSGQYSNRLWQNLWLESFLFDQGIEFENPSLGEIASLWGGRWRWYDRLRSFVCFVLWRLKWLRVFRFDDQDQIEDYQRSLVEDDYQVRFVEGWSFRSPETVARYADYWRTKYQPRLPPDVTARLNSVIIGFDYILGIHIRGRDYKTWKAGRYLFSQAQYRLWVDQFIALQLGARIKVLLFSDEEVDQALFQSLPVSWEVAGGTVAEDYWLMSRCTILAGPPSTFTLWASFLGNNTCIQFQSVEDSASQAMTDRVMSPYYG